MGERAWEIAEAGSRYRLSLARIDPGHAALRFFVWQDSFETYLRAREIGEAAGFAAGWQPLPQDGEITVGGRSNFRVD